MRVSKTLTVVAVVVALSAVSLSAQASENHSSTHPKGFVESINSGGVKAGWMSLEYAKAHPAEAREFGIADVVNIKSADECDGDACIDVTGSGTTVTKWSSCAVGNVGCITGDFLRNWNGYYTTNLICPDSSGPGVYAAYLSGTRHFADQDALCNTWGSITGMPCILIKA